MIGQKTKSLERRYDSLVKVFPAPGERKITIIDFGPWGAFSYVEENGEITSYDWDIEHPERYCPNRQVQPPEHAERHAAYLAEVAALSSESSSFSSRAAPDDDPVAAFTRRDYEPPRPSDPVLYDHLTKFDKGPPLDPPLWETWSERDPIAEKPPLPDRRAGQGGPGLGELRIVEPERRRKRR